VLFDRLTTHLSHPAGEIDDAALLGLEADEAAPGVDTGNAAWAERALAAATQVLKGPGMEQLQLYVFR
jgi:hypothetical protein